MRELTIDLETWRIQEWDAPIHNGNERPPGPVVIFFAEDIHLALRQGVMTWPDGETFTVTASGYGTGTQDGHPYVFELFPARFNDDKPYEPAVYVGRWPD